MVLDDAEAAKVVGAYRSTYPEVVNFWSDIENAAKYSVEDKAELFVCDRFQKAYFDAATNPEMMRMVLPSGRATHYYEPRLSTKPNQFGQVGGFEYTSFSKTGAATVSGKKLSL